MNRPMNRDQLGKMNRSMNRLVDHGSFLEFSQVRAMNRRMNRDELRSFWTMNRWDEPLGISEAKTHTQRGIPEGVGGVVGSPDTKKLRRRCNGPERGRPEGVDVVQLSASQIRLQKMRQIVNSFFDPDRAPRLSPAMHAMFDELSATGFAYEDSIRQAMLNASNLEENTIRTRIYECIRVGYLIRVRGGIEILELPEARR